MVAKRDQDERPNQIKNLPTSSSTPSQQWVRQTPSLAHQEEKQSQVTKEGQASPD